MIVIIIITVSNIIITMISGRIINIIIIIIWRISNIIIVSVVVVLINVIIIILHVGALPPSALAPRGLCQGRCGVASAAGLSPDHASPRGEV